MSLFSGFRPEIPFLGKFAPKKQSCQFNPFGTTGTPMSPKSNDSYLSTKGCEENYFWIIIIYIIPKF